MKQDPGREMYALLKELFPIPRSITGDGVRETLKVIQRKLPVKMKINEVPTGARAFDWIIPEEWSIKDAYVMDNSGKKVIDYKKNNLHVVGYSIPTNKIVTLNELQKHLHSTETQPAAIPYVTSYYKKTWGFCVSHNKRKKLKNGIYRVVIDSRLKNGSLTYGEITIPGKSKKEVFLSTYICHPASAHNGLSGPVVTAFLVKWILNKQRRHTYRVIFIPETIGSIAYLARNLKAMKKNTIAGFNIACVGDNRRYSYLPTRKGDTLADRVALNILSFKHRNFIKYSFLQRGSDERQYNAPGIDLPVCSIMHSKYSAYPEHHTSLDNLRFVKPEGLKSAYDVLTECLDLIEENRKYKIKCLGEPHLQKRGLFPAIRTKTSLEEVKKMMNFTAYADGTHDLIDISGRINVPVWELYPVVERLKKARLI